MEPELPQATEVKKTSRRPMETNNDPRLQEDESTMRPVEELIEVQVGPNEPSCVVQIDKVLKKELARQLIEFISLNQDVLAWTHVDMVGIHPKVMCHLSNAPKAKSARCRSL